MKKYSKPTILVNDEYSEGVYAASGCYTVTASIRQDNQIGRTDYRIQLDGKHDSDHKRDAQTLTVSFNMPVKYESSSGSPQVREGTTIVVKYNYHQNPTDNIGLGDLVVSAEQGLQITSISLTD